MVSPDHIIKLADELIQEAERATGPGGTIPADKVKEILGAELTKKLFCLISKNRAYMVIGPRKGKPKHR